MAVFSSQNVFGRMAWFHSNLSTLLRLIPQFVVNSFIIVLGVPIYP